MEDSQKKQEKQRSIFDGVVSNTTNSIPNNTLKTNNNSLESILNNSSKSSSFAVKQRSPTKNNDLVFNYPQEKTMNFSSKNNENDIFNTFGKINTQPVKTPDNDILNSLLKDLNNNSSGNSVNVGKSNNSNMYNITPPTISNPNISNNFSGLNNNYMNNFDKSSKYIY